MQHCQWDGTPELKYRKHAHDQDNELSVQLEITQKIHKIIQHLSLLLPTHPTRTIKEGFERVFIIICTISEYYPDNTANDNKNIFKLIPIFLLFTDGREIIIVEKSQKAGNEPRTDRAKTG